MLLFRFSETISVIYTYFQRMLPRSAYSGSIFSARFISDRKREGLYIVQGITLGGGLDYLYLCRMKNEIEIPIQREEDLVAANLRRDNYSQKRDLQAMEINTAIATRLLAKDKSPVKCDKCGKEFIAEANAKDPLKCPDCR
jgi:DNA-directed RNA polymerase subunit RPC12/RpoP